MRIWSGSSTYSNRSSNPLPLKRLFFIVAVPLAFLVYGHALEAPYYLDDGSVMSAGRSVLVYPPFSVPIISSVPHVLSWLAFDLVGRIFPWDAAFYFRIAGLLLHVFAATALVWFVMELAGRVSTSLTAGLLFLLHPLASEPVVYIAQRYEVQATLFMFLTAAAYVRFRRNGRPAWGVVAALLFLIAIFSKQIAYVLPIWLGLIEVTFFPLWRSVPGRTRVLIGILFATLAGSAAVTKLLLGIDLYSPGQYLATQGPVLGKYLQLAAAPREQYLIYDFPLVQELSLPVLSQWLLVVAVLATGLLLRSRNPVIAFGILTFFVLLLPTTLVPQPNLFFEYRAYGALGGLAIAGAVLLTMRLRLWKASLIFALLTAFGIRTFERAGEWNDPVAFYEAHRRAFPAGPQALGALSLEYSARGHTVEGLQTLLEARANEDSYNAHYAQAGKTVIALNLVAYWARSGNLEAAERELERALSVNPYSDAVWQTQGRFYMNVERYEEAAKVFGLLTEVYPGEIAGWVGLHDASRGLGEEYRARVAAVRAELIANDNARINAYAWRIPERYGLHTIFVLTMTALGTLFVTGRWLWVSARPDVIAWLKRLSSGAV